MFMQFLSFLQKYFISFTGASKQSMTSTFTYITYKYNKVPNS